MKMTASHSFSGKNRKKSDDYKWFTQSNTHKYNKYSTIITLNDIRLKFIVYKINIQEYILKELFSGEVCDIIFKSDVDW